MKKGIRVGFEIGPRKLNIALTQLRCFASFLNYDLFQVNIVSDPSCRCGANREDSMDLSYSIDVLLRE
jgi:hypothetical protein